MVIVQVVKHRTADRLDICRRIVQGSGRQVAELLQVSLGGGQINAAFIEPFNATVRQSLGCMARRTRHLARQKSTLKHGLFRFGTTYNLCTPHDSLRLPLFLPNGRHVRHRWVHRTPAMAAGLTDHCWTLQELLCFMTQPSPWVPPKRRGRSPKFHPPIKITHDPAILSSYRLRALSPEDLR